MKPCASFMFVFMQYYISDTQLKHREFGRNVQSMVEYAKQLEDRDQRTRLAHEIVRIMSNLNPQIKELPDYQQQLWEYLFIIADFELDVDAPYPPPSPDIVMSRPTERMEYYRGKPTYRQYGKNVELMINSASEMEDSPEKTEYVNLIANTMRQFVRNAGKEVPPEEVIASHIQELSDNRLEVDASNLQLYRTTPPAKQHHPSKSKGRSKNKRRNKRRRKN